MKREVKIEVAAKLQELMEREGTNWVKPWVSANASGAMRNARSNRSYRGINVFLTSMAAASNGWTSCYWNTFRGWKALGMQVSKGSTGTDIVFWKKLRITDKVSGDPKDIMMSRFYSVFNADQLTEKYTRSSDVKADAASPKVAPDPSEEADNVIDATDAAISHGGSMACYSPSLDAIRLPDLETFKSSDGYYSTVFHELGHWTGHKSRLDRDMSGWFGNSEYAFEELVAEITSAFLCVATGVTVEPRADHARYLNMWIKGLRDKPDAVIRAFSLAQKAADHILGYRDAETLDIAA